MKIKSKQFKFFQHKLLILIIACCLLPIVNCCAQEKIETVDGCKYYIYTVEQGNTLYGISKKYNVTTDVLIQANPDLKAGIKAGQTIKVPIVKENKKLEKLNTPALQGNYILHKTVQGQTLYSISKLYNVEIKDIVAENEGVQNNMPVGMTIKIPTSKVKEAKAEVIAPALPQHYKMHTVKKGETLYSLAKTYGVDAKEIVAANNNQEVLKENTSVIIPFKTAQNDSIYKYIKEKLKDEPVVAKAVYNIGLLLPFYLDNNDSLKRSLGEGAGQEVYKESLIALQFYEGFMLALNELKKEGHSFKVHTYDSEGDSLSVKRLILKPELKQMDLIIGPFFMTSFAVASKFANENKIPLISPFTQSLSIIQNNPYVVKVTPSLETQATQLAQYLSDKHSRDNIILVNNYSERDKNLINAFVINGNKLLPAGNQIKDLTYNTVGMEGLKNQLSLTKNNIVVVLSTNQVFVTDFITKLNFSNPVNTMLFGLESWLNYENLDLDYLQNLNTHIVTTGFIDYESPETLDFMKSFREKFSTDPDVYAFKGFDIGNYYINGIIKYGKNFSKYNDEKFIGLQSNFNLLQTSPEQGFENTYVSIVKLQDLKLVKIK